MKNIKSMVENFENSVYENFDIAKLKKIGGYVVLLSVIFGVSMIGISGMEQSSESSEYDDIEEPLLIIEQTQKVGSTHSVTVVRPETQKYPISNLTEYNEYE